MAAVGSQLAAELERRRSLLTEAMEHNRVDALVSSQTSAWTEYVTGLPRLQRRPQPDEIGNSAWLMRDGRVGITLVHSNWKLELEPRLGDHRLDVRELTLETRTRVLRDLVRTDPDRVWVDEATSFVEFAALREAFPDTDFELVPAAAWSVRAAKSAWEVELMGAGARATARAYDALATSLPARFTAAELIEECEHQFEQQGVLDMAVPVNVYVLGRDASLEWGWTAEQARSYVVEPPSIVTVDGGARVEGYAADVGRTFFLGDPLPKWERAYDAAWRAQAAIVERLRPGAAASDMDAASRTIVEEAGLGETFWIPSGHALGLDVHEPPRFASNDGSTIAEGMTLSVEIGLWDRSSIGVVTGTAAFVEDTAVVREAGVEMLTNSPRSPLVVG